MEEIIRFVMLARHARFTVSELCEQFGISRKTGYKYLDRYAVEGMKGLAARSHRPHQFPQRTEAAVEALILAERRLHRTWGPKKLHKVLEVKHGLASPPARLAPLAKFCGVKITWGGQAGRNSATCTPNDKTNLQEQE
jgi:transposase